MNNPSLSVIIPVYNNSQAPVALLRQLVPILEKLTEYWKIVFVDDGSRDGGATIESLKKICAEDSRIGWISLSRNRGQQIAVYCGISTIMKDLEEIENSFIITMDDDLAHPPEIIPELLKKIHNGYEMVYAVPSERAERGIFNTSGGYLRDFFFKLVMGIPKKVRIGSYRIMTAALAKRITDNTPQDSRFIYISAAALKCTKNVINIEYYPSENTRKTENLSRYSLLRRTGLLLNLFLHYGPVTRGIMGIINRRNGMALYNIRNKGGWVKDPRLNNIKPYNNGNIAKGIKLHILGGSFGQLSAIHRAKDMGIHTIVSDINPEAPGILMADGISHASTFDHRKVTEDARKLKSSAFLATGTDQPVLTAAKASENLGIPYFLNPETALLVTNKREMKNAYAELGIPTSPFKVIGKETNLQCLHSLHPPLVIKPLDSQGQRGVLRLESSDEIPDVLDKVLSFSREEEVLIEEYYPSEEVTVTGWVEKGKYIHLTTTDRITLNNLPSIGVCPAHHFPSKYRDMEEELVSLTERIVEGFNIPKGPIYFQYLIGDAGIKINESACRLGGAYEDEFIPWVTGIDLLDIMIRMTCGMDYPAPDQSIINDRKKGRVVSLQMFFYDPGILLSQTGMKEILKLDGILGGNFLLKPGSTIGNRENSTQRAGYFIASGKSVKEVNVLTILAFNKLKVCNEDGDSILTAPPVLLPKKEKT